jgi:hypothetical protein
MKALVAAFLQELEHEQSATRPPGSTPRRVRFFGASNTPIIPNGVTSDHPRNKGTSN